MATDGKQLIDPEHVGTKTLATVLGCDVRTVRRLKHQGVLTEVGRGKYALGPAVQAYVQYQASGQTGESAAAHRTRYEAARADKLEIENQKAAAQVVPIDEVREVYGSTLSVLRDAMMAIPRRMDLDGGSREQFEDEVRGALTRAADRLESLASAS